MTRGKYKGTFNGTSPIALPLGRRRRARALAARQGVPYNPQVKGGVHKGTFNGRDFGPINTPGSSVGVTSFGPSGSPRTGVVRPHGGRLPRRPGRRTDGCDHSDAHRRCHRQRRPVIGDLFCRGWIVDIANKVLRLCTTAGSPGTWSTMATSTSLLDVQVFTAGAGQTWTKPTGFTPKRFHVLCIGAGGSGGGGAHHATSSELGRWRWWRCRCLRRGVVRRRRPPECVLQPDGRQWRRRRPRGHGNDGGQHGQPRRQHLLRGQLSGSVVPHGRRRRRRERGHDDRRRRRRLRPGLHPQHRGHWRCGLDQHHGRRWEAPTRTPPPAVEVVA